MGELEHGTYDDDCEDLTEEEINAFYNFNENGELLSDEEDPDQSDDETDSPDVNESGNTTDSDHGFGTEVCHS